MIACQASELPACCDASERATDVSSACDFDGQAMPDDLVCPRALEILTVLNDVFDSFSVPAEGGLPAGVSV